MATEISPELRQAVDASHGAPVQVVDLQKDERYVLIREEIYQRVAELLDQLDVRAMQSGIGTAFGPDGWADPAMDIYNDLDPRKP